METFYSTLKQLEAKDKESFIDDEGITEWHVRADGGEYLVSAHTEGTTVKFTNQQLYLCRAPVGFRRNCPSVTEEMAWLTQTMTKATKRMAALQNTILQTMEAISADTDEQEAESSK